jgi:hypothetical protein
MSRSTSEITEPEKLTPKSAPFVCLAAIILASCHCIELSRREKRKAQSGCYIMADWVMPLFTIVVGVALLMETLMIAVMFIALRRLTGRIEKIAEFVQGRVFPLISQFQLRMDEMQPRISGIVSEASELMHTARHQVERTDRVITATSDRVMAKLVYADEAITGTLESMENTAARIRRTVWAPMRSAKALLIGIQTGLSSYGRHVRRPVEPMDRTEYWASSGAEAHQHRGYTSDPPL